MNILITRRHYSRHGVDGILSISDKRVCDTCEHPTHHLPVGTYQIRIRRHKILHRKVPYVNIKSSHRLASFPKLPPSPQTPSPIIKPGNGPMRLLDGSIIVGQYHLAGVLIQSAPYFNRLIDRLDKAQNRGDPITLTIQ